MGSMTCWVFPESYRQEQTGIAIQASTPDEAVLKAQAISNKLSVQVDLWVPPTWDLKATMHRLGPMVNAEIVRDSHAR